MARANTVWVALNSAKNPIGAFTVAHECASAIDGNRSVYWVSAHKDGEMTQPVPVWTVEEFIRKYSR